MTRRKPRKGEKGQETKHGVPGFLHFSANPLCLCVSAVGFEFPNAIALCACRRPFKKRIAMLPRKRLNRQYGSRE